MKLGLQWKAGYQVWWIKHPDPQPETGWPWPILAWIREPTLPGGTDAVLHFVKQQLRELQ